MSVFTSPLRYPGGKRKMAPYLQSLFEQNGLCDGHYVEPYAGGAAVALSLLLQEYASHIHINDADEAIYAFWHAVLFETEEFCRRVHNVSLTIENWQRQHEILKDSKRIVEPNIELALAVFVLNRTCRSGIITAGPIGGKEQAGKWKLDVRFNKPELIERIEKIARVQSRISLYCADAGQLISTLRKELPKKTLIYVDPPYYVKGSSLYRDYYGHDDHVDIERTLRSVTRQKWVVTYDNVPAIREIYAAYNQRAYGLSYTVQEKTMGEELIIYGPGLEYDATQKPYLTDKEMRAAGRR